ncbi:PAS domain S-box protein [Psychroflexus planctonicus]|uniref:PAS domain-containing protein n=1 Tax=Psychroflexus planctonicus TaxID=1526575 RepID=A0ABQ1SIS4_9FLAO|nr:PAS domain S-box protein [Psychroflexus planctonicus]GGE36342.1 hypothetical protein GCM10010832_15680 [Psychroflexus planctonicus]
MKSINQSILKELIEQINDGVFVLNKQFESVSFNTNALQILAIKSKEAEQSLFTDFLNPVNASNFIKAASDAKQFKKEINIHANLGKLERCCLIKCKADAGLLYVYIHQVDAEICENLRKKSLHVDSNLLEKHLKYKNLIEVINANPSPTLVVNQKNQIILINKEFEQVFEYTNEQLSQTEIRKLFIKEEDLNEDVFKDKFQLSYWNARNDLKIKNARGKFIPVDVKINSFEAEQERFYTYVIRDIRKIKAFQRKIQSQDQQLKDIAWMHSHLMRQPITNILALINAVETCDTLEDKMQCINMLKECSYQFDSLIRKVFEKTGHKSIVT